MLSSRPEKKSRASSNKKESLSKSAVCSIRQALKIADNHSHGCATDTPLSVQQRLQLPRNQQLQSTTRSPGRGRATCWLSPMVKKTEGYRCAAKAERTRPRTRLVRQQSRAAEMVDGRDGGRGARLAAVGGRSCSTGLRLVDIWSETARARGRTRARLVRRGWRGSRTWRT